jgi:2-dehydro-3-deoxygluconokinase
MKKVAFIGECMAELRRVDDNLYAQSFAGDVYNSAVYMKRTFPDIHVELVSAVGADKISDELLAYAAKENVGTSMVARHPSRSLGLYRIHTDASGERSFSYWRSASAAKQMFSQYQGDLANELADFDMVLFSGITLAILEPAELERLWMLLNTIQAKGVKVVFDINYRPHLWPSVALAKATIAKACEIADVLVPGIEDFGQLFGANSAQEVIGLCQQFNFDELVLKDGSNGVNLLSAAGEHELVPLTPVTHVVDTTSAGDAFNGVYLGARLHEKSMVEATTLASKCAAFVIQHKGAIVDSEAYSEFSESL